MLNWWTFAISGLVIQTNARTSGSSLIYGPTVLHNMDLEGVDPFELCCYTNKNGKMSLLTKNYWNQESIDEAKKLLKGGNTIVSVSLIGQKKHGSIKNKDYCMYNLFINRDDKRATVVFRNSDILKKLLIDVYWLKTKLFPELGITDYALDGIFNAVTVRAPFYYIYLNWLKKEDNRIQAGMFDTILKNHLEDYPKQIDEMFLEWYKKPAPNYKSLERAGRRMKELDIWPEISKYINK